MADEEMKRETIEITDNWHEKLMSLPFKSSMYTFYVGWLVLEEPGRTIFLLKQKTKPHEGIKKRKIPEPYLPELVPIKDINMEELEQKEFKHVGRKKITPTYIGPAK